MKICMLNTLFPPNIVGGAEKSVSLLAAAHVKNGHSVSVVSLHNSAQEKLEDWNGVRAYYLPLHNIYWPFQTIKKPPSFMRLWWHIKDMWNHKAAKMVGQILDIEKPDVFHTNNLTGFSVAVWWEAKKRNIRIVHTLRDNSLLCAKGTLFNYGKSCRARCVPCVLLTAPKSLATAFVDEVIGNSHYTLNEHVKRRYFNKSGQRAVYNIADVAPMPMQPIIKNAHGEIIFGFLGRIEDEKGIQILLQACMQLPKTGWRLRIAGCGRDAYVAELKRRYQYSPIEWMGFVEPDSLFDNINALVSPSIGPESLSRTVIEAAARGIPVLLSNAGGQSELIAAGISGIVYPAMDVNALAGHMLDILNENGPFFNGSLTHAQTLNWANKFSAATISEANMATYK